MIWRPMATKIASRTNQEWLQALREPASAEALEELRAILLRGLRAALASKVNGDFDAISEDFVQEALLKILNSLETFRGESRFTTWAQKIAIHVALSELRRRRWKDIPLQTFTETSRRGGTYPQPAGGPGTATRTGGLPARIVANR